MIKFNKERNSYCVEGTDITTKSVKFWNECHDIKSVAEILGLTIKQVTAAVNFRRTHSLNNPK